MNDENHLNAIGEELAALKASNESDHKSYQRRLNALDIQNISNAQQNILSTINSIDGKVDKLGKRIDVIEREPGDKWKKLAFEIVKYVVLAAVGVAVGYIIKGV